VGFINLTLAAVLRRIFARSCRAEHSASREACRLHEMTPPFPPETPRNLLLFDGVCNLCSGVVKFVIDRDPGKRVSFCSLQSAAAAP
jgi:predicted DCC family thiol-disulfide oxidoreductase YuxK